MAVTVSRHSAEIKVISIFLMPCWLAQVDRLKRAMSQIKRAVSLHQCDAARRGSHFQLLRVMTTAREKKEWPLKVKDSLRALVWQYVHQMALLSLSNVFRGATWASRRRTIKSESLVERYECSYCVVIALCGLLSFPMTWIWRCWMQLDLKDVSSVMPNPHRSPFQLVFTSSALPLVNRKRLLLAALMNPSRLQKGK